MNSRAKVAARVAVAACSAVDSGFSSLSTTLSLGRIAFGLMFGDSWVQEGSCRSKHRIYIQDRKEGGRGSIGPIHFIL